ncbi:MAG: hypothetical protein ACTSRU_11095 [Candidatus Hodarchaeales archaeon]
MITDKGKVGPKGELFPSKKIQEAIGLKRNQRIKYSVVQGRLIVEIIPDPVGLLSKPHKVIISWDEFKRNRSMLSKELEKFNSEAACTNELVKKN